MKSAQRYTLDKDSVTYRIIGQEAVILNMDNGNYYSLNKTGTLAWKALVEGKNLDEILALLKKKYPLPEERLKKDLSALAKDLEKEKLLELSQ